MSRLMITLALDLKLDHVDVDALADLIRSLATLGQLDDPYAGALLDAYASVTDDEALRRLELEVYEAHACPCPVCRAARAEDYSQRMRAG